MRSPFRATRARAWRHAGARGAVARAQLPHARPSLATRTRAAPRARGGRRAAPPASRGSTHRPVRGPDWSPFLALTIGEANRELPEAHRTRPPMSRRLARRSARRLHLDLHANGSRTSRRIRSRLPADATYHWDLYVASAERGTGVGTALAFARLHHSREQVVPRRLEADRHRQPGVSAHCTEDRQRQHAR